MMLHQIRFAVKFENNIMLLLCVMSENFAAVVITGMARSVAQTRFSYEEF